MFKVWEDIIKTFTIQGKQIEFDESLHYMDFQGGQLSDLDFLNTLAKFESGEFKVEGETLETLRYLERWISDAPRKRFYRDMRRSGAHVLSNEVFFEDESNSDDIIDNLENTGKFVRYFLEQLGFEAENYWDKHEPLP